MASPVARGLFHKAIGESGAYFGSGPLVPQALAASEQSGVKFGTALGADSIAALRAKPAEEVLQAALKIQPWFSPTVDGYFLPEDVATIFAAGKQARVPLLAGWNADEVRSGVVLAKHKATAQSFTDETRKRYGQDADAILKAYPAGSDPEALESAASLASDMFIGYGTWKWIESHARTGRAPVYRYSFDRKIPVPADEKVNGFPATARDIGARHAGEIEYVFGSLDSRNGVPWEPVDRTLSDAMTSYWAAFARTGEPKAKGLPKWPRYAGGKGQVLHLDEKIAAKPDAHRPRYEALDAFMTRPR
jgi:para-nitrobenzyl esterase